MAYASVTDIEARLGRTLTTAEAEKCEALLDDAAVIIDSNAIMAQLDAKKVVSCRMVSRALGDAEGYPTGASQGSMAGLGYSQSWTMPSGGSSGELYLGRLEKQLLGMGNKIGTRSPIEDRRVCHAWSYCDTV